VNKNVESARKRSANARRQRDLPMRNGRGAEGNGSGKKRRLPTIHVIGPRALVIFKNRN
jgi:hypothetical protein